MPKHRTSDNLPRFDRALARFEGEAVLSAPVVENVKGLASHIFERGSVQPAHWGGDREGNMDMLVSAIFKQNNMGEGQSHEGTYPSARHAVRQYYQISKEADCDRQCDTYS